VEIATLLEHLNEFPGLTDEVVNASVSAFQGDLEVGWGSRLFTHPTYCGPANAYDCVVLGIVPRSILWYANRRVGSTWFTAIVTPGQFRYPAVQRYLHDLSKDLGEHVRSVTSTLSLFVEVGKLFHFASVLSLSPLL